MHALIEQMLELTRVDREIVQIQEQLKLYPTMIERMDRDETRQKQVIEQAEGELEAARHDRREAEKEMKNLRDKVSKYLGQQSQVKTNKEYQAITHEIDAINAQIDEWETKGLEKLEIEDAAIERRDRTRARLDQVAAEHKAERDRIQTQIVEKRERLDRLTTEQRALFGALPEDRQQPYELLNIQYPGSVCVRIDGDHCGGCHWRLVAQTVQDVRAGTQIVQCNHCRRFLYTTEVKG